MKIPKKFNLFGKTITVEWKDDLVDTDDVKGQAEFRFDKITLQRTCKAANRSKQDVEATFLHELVHWIFHVLNEHDLVKNEKLVEQQNIFCKTFNYCRNRCWRLVRRISFNEIGNYPN